MGWLDDALSYDKFTPGEAFTTTVCAPMHKKGERKWAFSEPEPMQEQPKAANFYSADVNWQPKAAYA